MNIDIKETKRRDKETFEHLITVLSILFGDAREAWEEYDRKGVPTNKKDWIKAVKKERRLIKEATKYLKEYIEELITQKNENRKNKA